MPKETSYTEARANFASWCDEVAEDREVLIIHRRGAKDVALIAANELASLTRLHICCDRPRMLNDSLTL
jgi:antitoxin YefM